MNQLVQGVDELLRPADGEGGHDEFAALATGLVDNHFKLAQRLRRRFVFPVSVGALDQQEIRFVNEGGIAQDGPVGTA